MVRLLKPITKEFHYDERKIVITSYSIHYTKLYEELKQAGVDPYADLSRLQFFDFPQDNIVLAVRDGRIDAGTVRAETLERMILDGRVERSDFRILNALSADDYPFPHSTRLYPEWSYNFV